MGIYDREYYQTDEPRGFQGAGQRSVVTSLIIVNVVFYVADLLLGGSTNEITKLLELRSDLFSSFSNLIWSWQLLTYGFVHAPITTQLGLAHILLNMYGLYLFGREMEQRYGRFEFLRLYLAMIVFGGLVWAVRHQLIQQPNSVLMGASGAVMGVMVLYCLHFPRRILYLMGILPVPAWLLAVGFVGLDILRGLDGNSPIAFDVHLAGAAFAFAYFQFKWNLGRLVPSQWFRLDRLFKTRPQLKVHRPEKYYRDLDEQADRILDKVHQEGEGSLSSEERRILEDYSRRMRQKHR
jgi:membrane associated rhomboid family serine protease